MFNIYSEDLREHVVAHVEASLRAKASLRLIKFF